MTGYTNAQRRGFTVLEILVTLAIIGIIIAVGAPGM
jgi:prepilin-type N-terminal cleavage/methylation domain-containing protein